MASGRGDKWLRGVRPDDPVSKAAQRALSDRLRFLWKCLPLGANHAAEDIEHVHQMRVASRRTMAALDTFAALLPPKKCQAMRKTVKKIRRAAGDARDDDVLLMRLAEKNNAAEGSPFDVWREHVQAERVHHQRPIRKIYHKLKAQQFERRIKKLVKSVRWRASEKEPDYHTVAVWTLTDLMKTLEPALAGRLPEPEQLHPLRIEGKRLRYACELFAGSFPDISLRNELYPKVERLQDLLGRVNDHVTTIARIESWLDAPPEDKVRLELHHLLDEESAGLEHARQEFQAWWEAGEGKLLLTDLQNLIER